MDLLLSSTLVAVVFGAIAYKFFINLQAKKTKPNGVLPPGRTGWPIIGESINLISAGKAGEPERFVRERMKKYSPDVFKTSIATEKVACFCGVAGNKFVFSNENKQLKSWWPSQITKVMLSKGSPVVDTKKFRDALSQFLRPDALKYYVPIMDEKMKRFMAAELVINQVFKAFPIFKELAFSLSSKLFLNTEDPTLIAKLGTQFEMLMAGLFSVPINLPGTNFRRAINSAIRFREQVSPLIKQTISEPTTTTGNKHDLLSYLIAASADQPDIDEETILKGIVDTILTVLMASHDTTSCVMAAVVYFLADHPHVYKQVMEEQIEIKKCKQAGELLNWDDVMKMKYSRNVVNEALRLVPPGAGAFKEAITDITYAGFIIPKGWKIYWTVHSTHKDPKYFENPEEFNPSRFEGNGPVPYSFIPFGLGPRMCPGAEFSRTEVLVFVHNLVTRYRFEKLVQNEKFIYNPLPVPAHGLPIRLLPHDDNNGN
uniref:Beta-amyrin 12,13-epoxidase n=1 Tax=Platycodon grandiflorus TaxID=94286 RepID=A0A1I9Q5Z1_PLAGD|nr:beta-amyrin 12,13-epoxidase [Platycodon grandiflorus]